MAGSVSLVIRFLRIGNHIKANHLFTYMIHQLNPSIRMYNETFGNLVALLVIDYGKETNIVFVCKIIKTGKVKSFSSNQVTIPVNSTFEINL